MYPFWIYINGAQCTAIQWLLTMISTSAYNAKEKGKLGKKTNRKVWESIILPHMEHQSSKPPSTP